MKYFITALATFVLLAAISCGGKSPVDPPHDPEPAKNPDPPKDTVIHVLFIGNSLTYVNDLPGTVSRIAASGNKRVICESVAMPGYALIDHLDGGSNAVEVIRRGGWDYVVLQQGPSSLQSSRVILVDGVLRFDKEIRAVGARTALYMVWPDKSRFAFFEDVRLNYKFGADTVGGLFLPAGEAWLTAWKFDSTLALYGPDDFHPSPLGTFLAGLVIFEGITGCNPEQLPLYAFAAGDTLAVPDETISLLHRSAHLTNARYAEYDSLRWGCEQEVGKRYRFLHRDN